MNHDHRSAQRPSALGLQPTFGFGDRLGVATPGHLDALRAEGGPIRPIFAQQSIREMNRTERSPDQVISAAAEAVAGESFSGPWGADADHLKCPADVDVTADAGFVFYTIDPSDHVDQLADAYDSAQLRQRFDAVAGEVDWLDRYRGKTIPIKNGPTLTFDEVTVRRAAVKYGAAIRATKSLAAYIRQAATSRGLDHEIELSVDETPQPTTLCEHYIIAEQCLAANMKLVSVAPRYIGDFEKAVDYKDDINKLERSLAGHAAIAHQLGPYKLSLHSGSDKLSMYPSLARATGGLFHVKTAGTSYLEALRVVSHHDRDLFRTIIDFARRCYGNDKATYHVSAQLDSVPPPDQIGDLYDLERQYLGHWSEVEPGHGFNQPGRQILHCTFGSVMTDPKLGPALGQLLDAEQATYRRLLAEHFARHLSCLRPAR